MKPIQHALRFTAASLIFSGIAAAETISFHDGLEVLVPAPNEKTNSVDGGTCIDASGYPFTLKICLYRKSFEDMAASRMFFEYQSLSAYEIELAGQLPEDFIRRQRGKLVTCNEKRSQYALPILRSGRRLMQCGS